MAKTLQGGVHHDARRASRSSSPRASASSSASAASARWSRSLLGAASAWCASSYGVDEDTCTGDHSCIRLSGCPTLTVKDNPDPLQGATRWRTVIDGCVGCGLCGENAHAAILCPSFYRAEVVQNPECLERFFASFRGSIQKLFS